jgi:hypothetical protein
VVVDAAVARRDRAALTADHLVRERRGLERAAEARRYLELALRRHAQSLDAVVVDANPARVGAGREVEIVLQLAAAAVVFEVDPRPQGVGPTPS